MAQYRPKIDNLQHNVVFHVEIAQAVVAAHGGDLSLTNGGHNSVSGGRPATVTAGGEDAHIFDERFSRNSGQKFKYSFLLNSEVKYVLKRFKKKETKN
ncbi:unnamed protein product [Arctia plantaginis]|uniref:Uncharacterized protein n=1 Tax=Arctia plantaginis TaxID=874455 RepID=A0A8S0Z9X2_ARCPL|nr:unnamed protein product [Arctia plantaginis]